MNNEDQEKQRKDIERKRKALKDQFGMSDFKGDSDLPPEMESQWLDHIMAFEKQADNPETISVFERLGSPKFILAEDLTDKQLGKELNKIVELMAINSMVVDTICDVEERVIYKFITEELFTEEIDDIRVAGMRVVFIYEEFHPNHEYDIAEHSEDVIHFLFRPDPDFKYISALEANQFVSYSGNQMDEEQVKKIISSFQKSYGSFELTSLIFDKIEFDLETEKGKAFFMIEYSAIPQGGEAMQFSGKGVFNLISSYGYWVVVGIDMPGLRI